jgi:hypothetical protein
MKRNLPKGRIKTQYLFVIVQLQWKMFLYITHFHFVSNSAVHVLYHNSFKLCMVIKID